MAERKNEIGANKLKQWSLMKREINKAKNEWYEIRMDWITRKYVTRMENNAALINFIQAIPFKQMNSELITGNQFEWIWFDGLKWNDCRNVFIVMLGDKGFEPMNTVIIIIFLNFELYFNHEHKINLFTKLILWNQRYLRIS